MNGGIERKKQTKNISQKNTAIITPCKH